MHQKQCPRKPLAIILTVLSLLCESLSTMIVVQPQNSGFIDNKVPYSYANFGKITYGRAVAYKLMDLGNELCSTNGLDPIQPTEKGTYLLASHTSNCSYTRRALTAQALGAEGIIIGSDLAHYEEGVLLADDGNGRKVHIAVLFIVNLDYKKLASLKDPEIKMSFDVVRKDKSEVLFFLSSSGRQSYVFLRDFQPFYEKIKEKIHFEPIYYTIECESCSSEDCVMNNKFCAFDQDTFRPNVGSYIVKESFRQSNLWSKHPGKWFEYMDRFDQTCDLDWYLSKQCSAGITKGMGISQNLNLGDQEGTMNRWRSREIRGGFHQYPQISVNGVIFSGSLQPAEVFNMICSSLSDGKACLEQDQGDEFNFGGLVLILGIVFSFNMLIILLIYRKYCRRELTDDMTSKVNELVAKYATSVSAQEKKRRDRVMERMNQEL